MYEKEVDRVGKSFTWNTMRPPHEYENSEAIANVYKGEPDDKEAVMEESSVDQLINQTDQPSDQPTNGDISAISIMNELKR